MRLRSKIIIGFLSASACGLLALIEFVAVLTGGGDGNSTLLRDQFKGFRKWNLFSLHYERKNIATRVTTKAVEELFVSMNRKRRCFFRMKGAKPLQCIPRAFQADVLRNYADNIGRIANSFGEVVH